MRKAYPHPSRVTVSGAHFVTGITDAGPYFNEYAEGYHQGIRWAEADLADSIPSAHGADLLAREAQSSQRWARAFYLGALRGYRSVARTLKAGRWGL